MSKMVCQCWNIGNAKWNEMKVSERMNEYMQEYSLSLKFVLRLQLIFIKTFLKGVNLSNIDVE